MSVLNVKNVSYSYGFGMNPVLKNISMDFQEGTIYAIVGKSGAGKTTLLSLIAGLETTREGAVSYKGTDLSRLNRDRYRSSSIGVVFQSFNLLPHLTALENVLLSMDISGVKTADARAHAMEILGKVGLDADHANRRVLQLSGGEQQRVAIARALSYNPDIILADEPTGNLDSETEEEVIRLLCKLAHEEGKCVIVVTHSKKVSGALDKTFVLDKGKLVS